MKIRNAILLGFSGLCLGLAGVTYGQQQKNGEAMEVSTSYFPNADCSLDGIETSEGILGCFQPVIAIIDESFHEENENKVSQ